MFSIFEKDSQANQCDALFFDCTRRVEVGFGVRVGDTTRILGVGDDVLLREDDVFFGTSFSLRVVINESLFAPTRIPKDRTMMPIEMIFR